ncbi:MAG: energy transducer TonB [Acidobacteriia bacterium]|nr:energy transducer TonB [Terriglobia bacterium]
MFLLLGVLLAASCVELRAQAAAASAPAATAALPSYPDNAGGLEKLVKDIFRAAKDGDAAQYGALVSSLAQPVPEEWYRETFGEDGGPMFQEYQQGRLRLEGDLSGMFRKMGEKKATSVVARKHEASCDDDAGELIYPVMVMRQKAVPLYELRFFKGERFYRMWAIVYVEGGFRFAGNLHPPESFSDTRKKVSSETEEKRIRMGGNATAAKILQRIQPLYPEKARRERLQGTVKLFAIIGKDGSIHMLRVATGYCSLAQEAMRAVRQWRYSPTLLEGQPVEVETTIDVIFSLNY